MKDGGPAFPAQHFDLADGEHGMTLRDWYAGMAMQGLFAGLDRDAQRFMAREAEPAAAMAKACYAMADAMLKERSKT